MTNIKKLYGFYRKERIAGSKKLDWVSLNWGYSLSFYANGQYSDYVEAGLISIKDLDIPTDRYTKEVVPWIKDLREFVYMEYNADVIELELATTIINKIGARFDLELLDATQAKEFIRTHTNLVEESEGRFLIQEAQEDDLETNEAKYLIIE